MNLLFRTLFVITFFTGSQKIQSQTVIFYLHGRIVELQGRTAVDQTNGYGAYQYDAIIDSLKRANNSVYSEVRPPSTEIRSYAKKIAAQIDSLLKTGMPANHITIVGASKGARIAMEISNVMKNKDLNFVFMAACYEEDDVTEANWFGNVLSIYERSDKASSCQNHQLHSQGINHYKEIALQTGLKHGFIFKPMPEWLAPVLQWSNSNYR